MNILDRQITRQNRQRLSKPTLNGTLVDPHLTIIIDTEDDATKRGRKINEKKGVHLKIDEINNNNTEITRRNEIARRNTRMKNEITRDRNNNKIEITKNTRNNNNNNSNYISDSDDSTSDSEVFNYYEDALNTLLPENTLPIDNINLCFVGGVSTGKSTILNAIFCEELTQCKIKRTTMVPTIYIENENNSPNVMSPESIFTIISDKNTEIIKKTESGTKLNTKEYDELKFNVGKLDINILNGSYVNVYDIPGLNDARTKDIYYDYLNTNFTKFNLVILIVDIHSGLNTSDEIDIVNFITNHTRDELTNNKKEIYTLVVVNKADDMQADEEDPEATLKLTGELSEMFAQVENTITSEFKRHDIQKHLIGIIPLCAIDSYLYRMVKKHGKSFKLSPEQILKIGINENGKRFSTKNPATQSKLVYEILDNSTFINDMIKLSGFSRLESILHTFLTENNVGKEIRINNLLCELKKYPNIKDIVLINKQNISVIVKHVSYCMKIFKILKAIDNDTYNTYIREFLVEFNSAVEDIIRAMNASDDKIHIIEYYDGLYTNIFKPHFSEFILDTYPVYMKDHVLELIHNDFNMSKPIQLETISHNFKILQIMKMFNPDHTEIIFSSIMSNELGKHSIYVADENVDTNIKELIDTLKDCEVFYLPIMSSFIRFILINLYTNNLESDLYKAQMIFYKHGEIPMYTYLTNTLNQNTLKNGNVNGNVDIDLYVYGLTAEDFNTKYMLELYYISYEKNINVLNFVNSNGYGL